MYSKLKINPTHLSQKESLSSGDKILSNNHHNHIQQQKLNDNETIDSKSSTYNFKLVEENDNLKIEIDSLLKELESAKKRRDWAFIERDKILKERESIRALCDEMRYQRDRAISELAESLRESDELRKQKSMAIKQISHLE